MSVENLLYFGGIIIAAIIFLILFFRFVHSSFRYVSPNQYGVVEKIWSRKGSIRSGLISLDGRAGFQPDILRTGPHFFIPGLYRVRMQDLITVRTMAYIYARDGQPLPAGQTLAHTPEGTRFEDARAFLLNNGQRGPQRAILREGIYAINTALFIVITDDKVHMIDIGGDKAAMEAVAATIQEREGFSPVVIRGAEDSIGVVTVHDGPALTGDEIIAPRVGDTDNAEHFHNSFQDIEAFLAAGGRRGRQEQVLVEGTYFINRLFATVERKPKTLIPVGEVGVMISYLGPKGQDLSGDEYKHGELVAEGYRGVLAQPLRPGKYAINPYARDVMPVPTTNFVLRWIAGRVEDHGFDRGLSEISLITLDAFQPLLPISVVVHISPDKAPRVIQRFADIKRLVDQTIDPMVSAFFKDVAQKSTLIDLIGKRAELQKEALTAMKTRFAEYDLDLLEVMIGTPRAAEGDNAIPTILDQLRARQVAVESRLTLESQQVTALQQQILNEARAKAEKQPALTASAIQVEVANNEGLAALNLRTQEALGIQRIGQAEANVIKAKTDAYTGEGADRQLRQVIMELLSNAIIHSPNAIVPGVSVQGGGGSAAAGGSSMVEAMMALALSERTQDRRA